MDNSNRKIKLIALDVDGTLLLKHNDRISEAALAEIERLMDSGIHFCFSSGRQFSNLQALAERLSERFYYICENGAVIYGDGAEHSLIFRKIMDRDSALRIAETIRMQENCDAVVCGTNMFYIIPKTDAFRERMTHYNGGNCTVISSYDEMREPIVLVSGFSGNSAELRRILLEKCDPTLQYAVSGQTWVDISDFDKGQAIRILSDELGIKLEEVAAFGDNWNDVQILDTVGYPYIRDTAADELKTKYKNVFRNVEDILQTF